MKRILSIIVVAVISISALSAQNAKLSDKFLTGGIHAGYGTNYHTLVGVHGDFSVNNFRGRLLVDADFSSHFAFGAALDFHYIIGVVDRLQVYPIVGAAACIHPSRERDLSLGVDLGAGIEFDLTREWAIFYETKYQLMLLGYRNYSNYVGVTFAF